MLHEIVNNTYMHTAYADDFFVNGIIGIAIIACVAGIIASISIFFW